MTKVKNQQSKNLNSNPDPNLQAVDRLRIKGLNSVNRLASLTHHLQDQEESFHSKSERILYREACRILSLQVVRIHNSLTTVFDRELKESSRKRALEEAQQEELLVQGFDQKKSNYKAKRQRLN